MLYAISQCYPTTVQLYAINVIFSIILSAWLWPKQKRSIFKTYRFRGYVATVAIQMLTVHFFSNSSIELSNSFSVLSSDDYIDSLSSPLATYSPYKQRNTTRGDIRTSICDTGENVATKYAQATHAKRQSLKTLVINFCSIRNKVAGLAVCIGKYNPDIIICCSRPCAT